MNRTIDLWEKEILIEGFFDKLFNHNPNKKNSVPTKKLKVSFDKESNYYCADSGSKFEGVRIDIISDAIKFNQKRSMVLMSLACANLEYQLLPAAKNLVESAKKEAESKLGGKFDDLLSLNQAFCFANSLETSTLRLEFFPKNGYDKDVYIDLNYNEKSDKITKQIHVLDHE